MSILGGLESTIISFGYVAIFAIVFAESGLFFGFFLPGDSLLFTVGLLSSQGLFDIRIALLGIFIAAVLGDQVGYWAGSKYGRKLFNKPDSFFFNPDHITRAEAFYAKHGKKTIVLARFVPLVRTFAPIVAGMSHMDRATFTTYNILGGALWTLLVVSAGYFLGSLIPNASEYLDYIVIAIVVLSLIPVGIEILKSKKESKKK